MSKITLTEHENSVALTGELSRETIEQKFELQTSKLASKSQLDVNLSALTKVDMAGLAWLLHLVELANKSHCQLSFSGASNDLLKLAKLSAVDSFLPLQ